MDQLHIIIIAFLAGFTIERIFQWAKGIVYSSSWYKNMVWQYRRHKISVDSESTESNLRLLTFQEALKSVLPEMLTYLGIPCHPSQTDSQNPSSSRNDDI